MYLLTYPVHPRYGPNPVGGIVERIMHGTAELYPGYISANGGQIAGMGAQQLPSYFIHSFSSSLFSCE